MASRAYNKGMKGFTPFLILILSSNFCNILPTEPVRTNILGSVNRYSILIVVNEGVVGTQFVCAKLLGWQLWLPSEARESGGSELSVCYLEGYSSVLRIPSELKRRAPANVACHRTACLWGKILAYLEREVCCDSQEAETEFEFIYTLPFRNWFLFISVLYFCKWNFFSVKV